MTYSGLVSGYKPSEKAKNKNKDNLIFLLRVKYCKYFLDEVYLICFYVLRFFFLTIYTRMCTHFFCEKTI